MPFHALHPMASILIGSFLLLGIVQNAQARPPSWGQCSCPVSANPKAGKAKYSIVENASLCVNVKRLQPMCNIHVKCLNDDTDSKCKRETKSTLEDFLQVANTFSQQIFSNNSELGTKLTNILENSRKNSEWALDCISHYHKYAETPTARRAVGSWTAPDNNLVCIYTESGWLHIVIPQTSANSLSDGIMAISYQFAP